jgi:hypothetical protein
MRSTRVQIKRQSGAFNAQITIITEGVMWQTQGTVASDGPPSSLLFKADNLRLRTLEFSSDGRSVLVETDEKDATPYELSLAISSDQQPVRIEVTRTGGLAGDMYITTPDGIYPILTGTTPSPHLTDILLWPVKKS